MKLEISDRAIRIAANLRKAQEIKDSLSLQMGKDGLEAKKMGKDFLRANDADSWKSWCAETGNPNYNTFSKYVRLYKIYGSDGLGISDEQWIAIGPHKLEIISKYISMGEEGCKPYKYKNDILLDQAQYLSVSDLIITMGGNKTRNKDAVDEKEASNGESARPLSPNSYRKLVKESDCIICHSTVRDSEYAHFPRTRVHGAFGIPLCRVCHGEMDNFIVDGHVAGRAEWFAANFRAVGEWLDKLIGG